MSRWWYPVIGVVAIMIGIAVTSQPESSEGEPLPPVTMEHTDALELGDTPTTTAAATGPPTSPTPGPSSSLSSGARGDAGAVSSTNPTTTSSTEPLQDTDEPHIGPGALPDPTVATPPDHGHEGHGRPPPDRDDRHAARDRASQFVVTALSGRYDIPARQHRRRLGDMATGTVVDQWPAMGDQQRATSTVRSAVITDTAPNKTRRDDRWRFTITARVTTINDRGSNEHTTRVTVTVNDNMMVIDADER